MRRFWLKGTIASLLLFQTASCGTGLSSIPDPEAVEIAYQTGLNLIEQRDFKNAKQHLMRAQPFRTNDTKVLMALAIASDMDGDFRTSDRAYAELLLRENNKAALYNNMGYSYMLRGNLDRAYAYLSEAERFQNDNTTVKNNIEMLRRVTPL